MIHAILQRAAKKRCQKDQFGLDCQARKGKQDARIRLIEERGCRLEKWRDRLETESVQPLTSVPISLVEDEIGNSQMSYSLDEGTRGLYMGELERLLRTAWAKKKMRSDENCPVIMKLAFFSHQHLDLLFIFSEIFIHCLVRKQCLITLRYGSRRLKLSF
jgi:hypothetical protein